MTKRNKPLDPAMDGAEFINRPGVYSIIHVESGFVYYGSSGAVRDRLTAHKWHLLKNRHHNRTLQRLYNRHEDLEFIVEYTESREEAYILEEKYLRTHRPRKTCVNIAVDVRNCNSGRALSHTHRESISRAHTGREMGELWRLRMSESAVSRVRTEEFENNRLNSVKQSVSVRVSINGTVYNSFVEAAGALGISAAAVRNRVYSDSTLFSTWIFLGKGVGIDD